MHRDQLFAPGQCDVACAGVLPRVLLEKAALRVQLRLQQSILGRSKVWGSLGLPQVLSVVMAITMLCLGVSLSIVAGHATADQN